MIVDLRASERERELRNGGDKQQNGLKEEQERGGGKRRGRGEGFMEKRRGEAERTGRTDDD